jgi:hypothetical protein
MMKMQNEKIDVLLEQLERQEKIVKSSAIKRYQEATQIYNSIINKYKPHGILKRIMWWLRGFIIKFKMRNE